MRPTLGFFIALLLVSCFEDAPRLNSYELEATVDLIGEVKQNISTTRQGINKTAVEPVAGATVTLVQTTQLAITNEDGQFIIPDLKVGEYTLTISAEGFAADTRNILVSESSGIREFFLNRLPVFIEEEMKITIATEVTFSDNLYEIRLQAAAFDADGDQGISRMDYEIPDLDTTGQMIFDASVGKYSVILDTTLNIDKVSDIIGMPIRFVATDVQGASSISRDYFATRVVESVPSWGTPDANITITEQPVVFEWENINVNNDWTYTIELRLDDVIARIENIPAGPPNPGSFIFPDTLLPGTYFWDITLIDNFGNSNKSRRKQFFVPPDAISRPAFTNDY